MNEPADSQGESMPAQISALRRVPALWLIPLVTLLVGLWLVYDHWASQGPLITIELASAEGLDAGKTKIKYRSIDVGEVESIRMNDTRDAVLIDARMSKDIEDLVVEGSRFWVAKPQIGLSGVSGLGTILSGYHIEFSPGDSGNREESFEGLEKPPLTPPGTPGLHITLNSPTDFSIGEGDAILYQGRKVGKIEDIFFNASERMMYYNAFIEAPYHKLVTSNTWFWNSGGIRAELGSGGVSVEAGDLETILLGGVSFGLVQGEVPGERVQERAYFEIFPSRSQIGEKRYEQALTYVLLLDASNENLRPGDPVMLRGIRVGQVLHGGDIPTDGYLLDTNTRIPVQIAVNPGQLGLQDSEAGAERASQDIQQWLATGMTAVIKSSGPLFGRQLVQLNLPENLVPTELAHYRDMPVIPVSIGSFDAIATQIAQLVDDISQTPIQDIGVNLNHLLVETTQTMASIQSLADTGGQVLGDVDQTELVNSINEATLKFGELAASYSTSSPSNRELRLLLQNLAHVLAELGPVLADLKNQPNSLIFGGARTPEPEPEQAPQ
jgi:paraquat-inducible protein B